MQSLWSRAASSQLTCRCVSCSSSTATGVGSRTAIAASKRRLISGNSVTALHTDIFAAALLTDARIKTERRHGCEERIAAGKAEVDNLAIEEQLIVESLQSRGTSQNLSRILHGGRIGSKSNSAPPFQSRSMLSGSTRCFHTERGLSNATNTAISDDGLEPVETDLDTLDDEGSELGDAMKDPFPDWALRDHKRVKAIKKLALRQFAIRLLLRPIIAHRYQGLPMNYITDWEMPQVNVDKLLAELNNIRLRIHRLKHDPTTRYDDLIKPAMRRDTTSLWKDRQKLDEELQETLEVFTSGQMTTQEVLLRISSNLLNSSDPERTSAFRAILRAFSQTRQNDINDLLLRMLLPNHFHLSPSLINTILSFFRKTKNLKEFDMFLEMLTGAGYVANLGSMSYFSHATINGIKVAVPSHASNNPIIVSELICTALRFGQPDRADAWLQVGRAEGFFDNFFTLAHYLRYYSITQNWEKGVSVLKRCLAFIISSTEHDVKRLERLVVLMVQFCDACCQSDVSADLIAAAMYSGFDPRISSQQLDVAALSEMGPTRWTSAAEQVPKDNVDRPMWQKCSDLATIFGARLSKLDIPQDNTKTQQLSRLASRHAQQTMESVFADRYSQTDLPEKLSGESCESSRQPESSIPDGQMQRESSSSELNELKEEVAKLRELVLELRSSHIRASFKSDKSEDIMNDAPDLTNTAKIPSSDSQPSHSSLEPLGVHVEQLSDEFKRRSSSTSFFRGRGRTSWKPAS